MMSARRGEGQGRNSPRRRRNTRRTQEARHWCGDAGPDPQCCLTAFKRWQGSQWDCDNGNSESRHARALPCDAQTSHRPRTLMPQTGLCCSSLPWLLGRQTTTTTREDPSLESWTLPLYGVVRRLASCHRMGFAGQWGGSGKLESRPAPRGPCWLCPSL